MDFSQAVKRRMKQLGWNGYDLAKRIGYKPASVYRLLRGERRWSEKSIDLVCKALDLKLEVKPIEEGADPTTEGASNGTDLSTKQHTGGARTDPARDQAGQPRDLEGDQRRTKRRSDHRRAEKSV